MTVIQIITVILLLSQAAAQAAFVYRYGVHSPWRATRQGITLMAQTVTLLLLVLFFVFDTFIVDAHWPGRDAILITFLVLLAVEAWIALLGLLLVQQANHPVSNRQGSGYVNPEEIEKE